MRKIGIVSVVLMLSSILMLGGCGTGSSFTLSHSGFDFSQGIACEDADGTNVVTSAECDGDINNFTGSSPAGTQLNFRTWVDSQTPQAVQDLGDSVSLGDISSTSIPTSWPAVNPELVVGHVYILKCQDGYAAFKVDSLAADPANDWEATVTFIYSADGTSW